MTRKILFLMLSISACASGSVFAQATPTPVSEVIALTTPQYNPASVPVTAISKNVPGFEGTETPFPEPTPPAVDLYLKQVLSHELGIISPQGDATTFQEGYNAFAVVARTNLDWWDSNNGVTSPISYQWSGGAANGDYVDGNDLIDNAVSVVGIQTILSYPNTNTQYFFSNSTGSYKITEDSGYSDDNVASPVGTPFNQIYKFYFPQFRMSPENELIRPGGTVQTDVTGLSEYGIMALSAATTFTGFPNGLDHIAILQHYYHSKPPILARVLAVENGTFSIATTITNDGNPHSYTAISGGNVVYQAQWKTEISPNAGAAANWVPGSLSRSLTQIVSKPIKDRPSSIVFRLDFSEEVRHVNVLLVSATAPQGVAVSKFSSPYGDVDGNIYPPELMFPPHFWFGSVKKSVLKQLGSGPITIVASARHHYTDGGLDSDPSSVALYFDGNPNYDLFTPNTYQPGSDSNHAITIEGQVGYLKGVDILQGDVTQYAASWLDDSLAQNVSILGPLKVAKNLPLVIGTPAKIDLNFNTSMNTNVPLLVKLVWEGGSRIIGGNWVDQGSGGSTQWEADGVDVSTGGLNVPIQLRVSGAQDLNGIPANCDPYFVAFQNADPAVGPVGYFYGDPSGPATGTIAGSPTTFWQPAITTADENFVFNKQTCSAVVPPGNYSLDRSFGVTLTQEQDPFVLRVDSEGYLYVPFEPTPGVEPVYVSKIDRQGNQVANSSAGTLINGHGFQDMNVSPVGELYVATSSEIGKFDPNFNFEYARLPQTPIGTNDFTFGFLATAVNPQGDPYVIATQGIATTFRMDLYAMFHMLWEQTQGFSFYAYSAASDNFLYSSEPDSNVISKASLQGQGMVLLGNNQALFDSPFEVAVDCPGNLYVMDDGPLGPGRIQVFNPADRLIASYDILTMLPPPSLQDYLPEGLAVDKGGNIYFGLEVSYFASAQDQANDMPTSISHQILRLVPGNPPTPVPTFTPTPLGTVTPQATAEATVGADGVTVSLPDGTSVQIGPNILDQGTTVTISQLTSSAVPPPGGFQVQGNLYTFVAQGPNGAVSNFGNNTVTLVFPFDPNQIPGGGSSSQLQVQYFDGSNWTSVPATVDTNTNTLTVTVNHFSIWGVFFPLETPTPTVTPTSTAFIVSCPVQATFPVNGPGGVALDASGNVYALDVPDNQVLVYSAQGELLRRMGGTGLGQGSFYAPAGIAVDSQGSVFVTDSFNRNVQVFDSQGNFVRQWGGFLYPIGIAAGPTTLIFVTDDLRSRVVVYNKQGQFVRRWGSSGLGGFGKFDAPTGVAVGPDGLVYVADQGTNLVQVFNDHGGFITQWDVTLGTSLEGAQDIAVGPDGVVYVDDGFGFIAFFDTNGNPLGSSLGGAAPFEQPFGVAAAGAYWAVADIGSNQVDLFTACALGPIATATPTDTPTSVAFNTATHTPTSTATFTRTDSPTFSATDTPSPTATHTPTDTATLTPTETPTSTGTNTATWTPSPTATDTPSATFTPTLTWTPTSTATYSFTPTPSTTFTSTPTWTPTASMTPTWTFTRTYTPTSTPTLTLTNTATLTATNTPSTTPTFTPTPTKTNTPSFTSTPSNTPSNTPTRTPSPTFTKTSTQTGTPTLTFTKTNTPAVTSTPTKTATPTPSATLTKTKTPTPTPSSTPTKTNTPTVTPTPPLVCIGTLTSPKLDLQVGCFQRDAQQERVHVKILNWGTTPVTLGNLSVKMWVNESQLVNMGQWVQLGTLCQANGTGCVNVTDTGFTAMVGSLSSTCTVDTTHKANQVVVFAANGSTQSIPANGGYWDGGLDLGVGRNNPQMDDNWTDDYSKTSACPANLMEDSHFALYYGGTLLKEWTSVSAQDSLTGGEPCCGGGAGSMMALGSMTAMAGDPGVSAMVVPGRPQTPDDGTGLIRSLVAAPNFIRGQEPIQFRVELKQLAKIHLTVLTISGEKVFETEAMGNRGMNNLNWDLSNFSGQGVASGLYLYMARIENGTSSETRMGKIVLIR